MSDKKVDLYRIIDNVKSENTNSILEILRLHSRIKLLNQEITELGGKKPVAQALKILRSERVALSEELKIQEDDIKKYDEAIANIDTQNRIVTQITHEIKRIEDTVSVVQQGELFEDFSNETKEILTPLINRVITQANEEWNKQKIAIVEQLSKQLKACNHSLDNSVETRNRLKSTIEGNNRIEEITKKIEKENENYKKIEEKHERVRDKTISMNALINDVASSYVGLHSAYKDFAEYIMNNTMEDTSGLQYEVQIPFRQNEFLAKWSELYRATNPNNRMVVDVDKFVPKNYSIDLLFKIITQTLEGKLTVLKAGSNPEQALRNILDDWYNIKYVVKMGNDSIDVMSPGKKALVLLQLLIDLADSDCPILIDQPEDDLDNRSIFEQLIPFIKRKKVNRQIIVVTHNANIVVGADAEEVIVANQDGVDSEKKSRCFEYRSGSIENDHPLLKDDGSVDNGILNSQGIQHHICDILEGGIRAFEKRKNKYHIQ